MFEIKSNGTSLNILVACEESQRVTTEFRNRGHNAFSCDIINCSGGHQEWHIKSDVIPLLNGFCEFKTENEDEYFLNGKWDMIIAFPPCTHLATSGATHFKKKREDGRQREALEFFCKFFEADCEKIAIENPINIIGGDYVKKWFPDIVEKYNLPKKPTQKIQPWMFGDPYVKTTCLWLKNLTPLIAEINEKPKIEYKEWVDSKTGKKKRQDKWSYSPCGREDRAKVRSKTFPGIARAIAEQWGE